MPESGRGAQLPGRRAQGVLPLWWQGGLPVAQAGWPARKKPLDDPG
jgi:hypothetical protein